MGNQKILIFIVFMINLTHVLCNYNRISINNVDVCRENKKKGVREKITTLIKPKEQIEIGEGSTILELKNPSKRLQPEYRNKLKECEIKLKAPDNFGIIAYIEEMSMRLSRKDGGCIDYIQFGKDDNIPWYTLEKSKKICGVKDGKTNSSRGVFFEEEDGNLLIWIALGGRRSTSHWNGISEVSLTLVVTAYQKCKGNDGKRRKCGNTDACILQDYFCDRRFNCPPDKFTSIDIGVDKHRTFDERGCNYRNLGLEDTTMSPDDLSNDGSGAFGDLNLVSLTLIIICLLCVPLILCLAVLQIRKVYSTNRSCCHCFGSNMSERTSCELPEGGPQSLVQLSSQRQRRPNDSEQNVYLPLTTFLDQPISPPATFATNESSQPDVLITNENSSRQVRQFTPDFPEEPPPAYNDLFPEGFPQLNESQEILTTEVSSNSQQLLANDSSNEASADAIDSIQLERVNQDVQQLQNDSLAETSNLGASSSSNTSVNQQLAIVPGAATSEANQQV